MTTKKTADCIICDEHKLLTVPEAYTYLGVSDVTMYKWLSEGKIPQVYLGPKSTRILSRDLTEFVQSLKRDAT